MFIYLAGLFLLSGCGLPSKLHEAMGGEKRMIEVNAVQLYEDTESNEAFIQATNKLEQVDQVWGQGKKTKLQEEVIALYTQILSKHPEDAGILNSRGVVQTMLGNYDAAIADFDQLIELYPIGHVVLNNRGNAYLQKNDLGVASADFQQALTYLDDSPINLEERTRLEALIIETQQKQARLAGE